MQFHMILRGFWITENDFIKTETELSPKSESKKCQYLKNINIFFKATDVLADCKFQTGHLLKVRIF